MKVQVVVGLLVLMIGLTAPLSGCAANDPFRIGMQSREKLKQHSTNELLDAYAINVRVWKKQPPRDSALRQELESRGVFSPEQWGLIEQKTIRMGEPENLAWLSWGAPDDVVESVTAAGKTRSLWYQDSTAWVYTDGEKITGWVD